ncbi:transposase [Candidatus Sororendozoicomonas aggregata]|uniref:transposase n=1 Tax=Candidatus Sororendozoicomonas aggregata TaxID=3073239 RepID=UPI003B75B865
MQHKQRIKSFQHISKATNYWKPVLWIRAYCLITAKDAPLSVLAQYIQKQESRSNDSPLWAVCYEQLGGIATQSRKTR